MFKNKHMAGHYGVDRVTIQNLEIVQVDAERNLLLVKGAVPGPNGGLLIVRNTCKARACVKEEQTECLRLLFITWKARPLARSS